MIEGVDADLLERLDALRIDARSLADSVLAGTHATRRIGSSIDFAEHREYRPGDDPRHLDPRVLARTDRDVVRRFQHESELRAVVALDTSASMDFAGDPSRRTKRAYAVRLLLGLSHVLLRQGDRVAAVDLADPSVGFVPYATGFGQLERIAELFGQRRNEVRGNLAEGLRGVATHATRRALVVIASDLIDDDADALAALAELHARGHVVVVFQVLDPLELDLDLDGAFTFYGLEGEGEVEADIASVRAAYLEEVRTFLDGVRRAAETAGAYHSLARTDEPEVHVLERLVAAREGR